MILTEIVTVRKANQCATCKSYIYGMPVPVDMEFVEAMQIFGQNQYPLDKVKLIVITSQLIEIRTSLGSAEVRIKYQDNYENTSALFREKVKQWLKVHGFSIE